MKATPKSPGGRFLDEKSGLAKSRQHQAKFTDILVVEDNEKEGARMLATLRGMFGYDVQLRRAPTLGSALDCVIERKPEIIFLDDHLPPSDTANNTIPFLRRCGYEGPIVVISSLLDAYRSAELRQAGVADAIHKDQVNSVRLAQALDKVYVQKLGNKDKT
jgi:CheY-like chemotaxis protein